MQQSQSCLETRIDGSTETQHTHTHTHTHTHGNQQRNKTEEVHGDNGHATLGSMPSTHATSCWSERRAAWCEASFRSLVSLWLLCNCCSACKRDMVLSSCSCCASWTHRAWCDLIQPTPIPLHVLLSYLPGFCPLVVLTRLGQRLQGTSRPQVH